MRLADRLPRDLLTNAFSSDELSSLTSVAVAVSGGSDSLALLLLAHEDFTPHSIQIVAMTVDHTLRSESRAEAERVAAICKSLGIEHRLLTWQRPEVTCGNLSNAAREARYRLMQEACTAEGIRHLLTGHTLDDQAETVLMRLARGSGVDGLSAIAPSTQRGSLTLKRPLLAVARDDLRQYLRAMGQDWIDDPTNDDDSYDRIKARKMFAALEPLGLTKQRLSTTARIMGMARDALEAQAGAPNDVWDWSELGFASTDSAEFWTLPAEIKLRRVAGALNMLTGATYRPRLKALEESLSNLQRGKAQTLHGCVIRDGRGKVTIMREPNALSEPPRTAKSIENWDNRFKIATEFAPESDLTIAALGEAGLRQIPKDHKGLTREWQDAYHAVKQTTPGLWRGDVLVSAPLAAWSADPDGPQLRVEPVWPVSCSPRDF